MAGGDGRGRAGGGIAPGDGGVREGRGRVVGSGKGILGDPGGDGKDGVGVDG